MFVRKRRLQSAPSAAIASDNDFAFDIYSQSLKGLIIVLHPIVDIDQRGADITVALIVCISRQRWIGGRGAGVAGNRRLLQGRLERFGSPRLQALIDRGWIEHPE